MRLIKLYSFPKLFEEITFYSGMNIISGDKNLTSDKTNGVGKSLCVDFINFCLLKNYKYTRLSKIPSKLLNNADIFLELEVNDIFLTIKRSSTRPEHVTIFFNNTTIKFEKLDDAKDYINNLYFGDTNHYPSFRSILGPIIRDESSEFKSLINCYDTNLRIPPDYSPHLFFFGLDQYIYKDIKSLMSKISEIKRVRTKLKEDIKKSTGLDFNEARAAYNELNADIIKIKSRIDNMKFIDNFEDLKTELLELESTIKKIKVEISLCKNELKKIDFFKGDNYIDQNEVTDIYNFYSKSLGDFINKDLTEVISFKKKIDNFQLSLLSTQKINLEEKLNNLSENCSKYEKKYYEKTKILEESGLLATLKISITEYQQKVSEQSNLLNLIKNYDENEDLFKKKKLEKEKILLQLNQDLIENKSTIEEFENILLDLYSEIMENHKCSFNIQTTNTKEVLDFDLRISSDGSHSINREKVFLYDISLLINPNFKNRHPGFLIHDNIFDMDQDTASKNFNFLMSYFDDPLNNMNSQYIFTLSSDKFLLNDEGLKNFIIAKFSKNSKFLNFTYSEVK